MASSIWDLHLTEEKNIDAETLSSFMFAVAGTISTLRHGDGDGRLDSYSPSYSGNTIEMPSVIHTRR